jgi:hypothetical protein
VSLYRVHFKWNDKEYQLTARSLDLTHPYFVSIKDLVFPKGKKLIIDPSEDDVRKAFSETNHIMIPLQSVSMIEELENDSSSRVMPFDVLDESKDRDRDTEG